MNHSKESNTTRRWVSEMIIGLNLCPFAKRVFDAEAIKYVVSEATDTKDLLTQLIEEVHFLTKSSPAVFETTLLIHPTVLNDFLEYNDFLGVVDRMLKKSGCDELIQIASFHPNYEFSDAPTDAVENYSNRSPYPMIHLLLVESVSKVVTNEEQMLAIPRRNIETLRAMGREEILDILDRVRSTG